MSSIEMPMGGRRAAARDAAERRKKLLLVGLVAVFLALLVYEVPHLLNRSGSSKGASSPATTSLTPATAAGSSVSLPGASATASRVRVRAIARLGSKDPFVPLIHESTSGSTASSSSASTSSSAAKQVASQPAPVKSIAVTPAKPAAAKSAPAKPIRVVKSKPAAPSAAVIWTNGRPQAVRVSQTFAIGDVTFRVISVGRQTMRIQVADGSFSGGKHVITVRKGRPVTLTNTATGVQYHLLFSRTK